MIKFILNKIFLKCKIFEEEWVYEKKTLFSTFSYTKDKARYIFAKNFIKGATILNMACGRGHGSLILLANNSFIVCGLDHSRKAISFAKARYQNENLKFYEGDVYNTGFQDNHFSSVVSIETIEHLNDHEKFLLEIKRILSEDGVLILSSPDKITKDLFFDNPHHINLLYKADMQALLKRHFKLVEIYCQTPLIKRPAIFIYLSLVISSAFLSSKIVKDKPYLTGTNCIFVCRGKL